MSSAFEGHIFGTVENMTSNHHRHEKRCIFSGDCMLLLFYPQFFHFHVIFWGMITGAVSPINLCMAQKSPSKMVEMVILIFGKLTCDMKKNDYYYILVICHFYIHLSTDFLMTALNILRINFIRTNVPIFVALLKTNLGCAAHFRQLLCY